ncbi:MAG: M3 family oligoendopeptidase [Spirochaetaceae bacterium]|jgi:pepF/M3 family oligoendopeptidase|nr:M3 family oligoendopeptidase [Spirochaetaceae bacterium]
MKAGSELPRWDLKSIYPSFDDASYIRDKELLSRETQRFIDLLGEPLPLDKEAALPLLRAMLDACEKTGDLAENLRAYAEAVYTCDTSDLQALNEINALETLVLPLNRALVLFRKHLAERESLIHSLLKEKAELGAQGFFIREAMQKAKYQMEEELEDLANDLCRSGGDAWSRLREAISSSLSVLWDKESGEKKTVNALRELAFHPERSVREKAYKAELEAWASMETPLAACLNGVKGWALSVDARRRWASPLEKSFFQSRITPKTFTALKSAMENSLPVFRRYLKSKAKLLGLESLAFYDLFAPVNPALSAAGDNPSDAASPKTKKWSWEETGELIARCFDSFDKGMGTFARHAFAFSWIDAGGRKGKVGGAYCTDFPLTGESRILCNFEGSFDSVCTVAHELGHAWHHEVLKDLPRTQNQYPMTLAETASIFAETIVFEAALGESEEAEKIRLIEGSLKDSCQVICDILSRFYFEKEVFARRSRGELSPAELCAIMTEAQKASYGDGLDEKLLHPYMWAAKSHYYSASLGFYNYPYAFGQLFSLALYAAFKNEKAESAGRYRDVLRATGSSSAEETARLAGFNIEEAAFWEQGMALIASREAEFSRRAQRR